MTARTGSTGEHSADTCTDLSVTPTLTVTATSAPGVPALRSSAGPGEARREQMEAAPAKPQGRLLVSTQLDAKDELEEVGCAGVTARGAFVTRAEAGPGGFTGRTRRVQRVRTPS